jgi:hypothetical protein
LGGRYDGYVVYVHEALYCMAPLGKADAGWLYVRRVAYCGLLILREEEARCPAWYARSEILRFAQNDKGEWVGALYALYVGKGASALLWELEDDDQSLWQGHQRYPVPL